MQRPRQVPRLDGSPDETNDPGFAQRPSQQADGRTYPDERFQDDPAGLIGAIFDEQRFANEDPATVILAWLVVLPPSIQPPDAGRSLLDRLAGRDRALLSDQQREVLDLLAFVSRHLRHERSD